MFSPDAYRAVRAHQNRAGPGLEEDPEGAEPEGAGPEGAGPEGAGPLAPQHRHYLSYEGVGLGTPSQRERQYRQARADRAAERVLEYRQQRAPVGGNGEGEEGAELVLRRRGRGAQITQAVERLVEDLIQESMARGDFQNLRGAGKPLAKFRRDPNADPATHNLNRILMDSGYQPPWVSQQREIREAVEQLRARLLENRARLLENRARMGRTQQDRDRSQNQDKNQDQRQDQDQDQDQDKNQDQDRDQDRDQDQDKNQDQEKDQDRDRDRNQDQDQDQDQNQNQNQNQDRDRWEQLCAAEREQLDRINKMVDRYNLAAPALGLQMGP
ncbi:unnamed protein product [Menidia menidia]|uniref:(Atlantic silverside) hypothetical protein n=1 Tax=Menidia menidia TaxID=238744 RepID=A0A8S4AGN3_9TELE|nr:unnamed protein product [Menidia menidia]